MPCVLCDTSHPHSRMRRTSHPRLHWCTCDWLGRARNAQIPCLKNSCRCHRLYILQCDSSLGSCLLSIREHSHLKNQKLSHPFPSLSLSLTLFISPSLSPSPTFSSLSRETAGWCAPTVFLPADLLSHTQRERERERRER